MQGATVSMGVVLLYSRVGLGLNVCCLTLVICIVVGDNALLQQGSSLRGVPWLCGMTRQSS
jgi:hypothetical protein